TGRNRVSEQRTFTSRLDPLFSSISLAALRAEESALGTLTRALVSDSRQGCCHGPLRPICVAVRRLPFLFGDLDWFGFRRGCRKQTSQPACRAVGAPTRTR